MSNDQLIKTAIATSFTGDIQNALVVEETLILPFETIITNAGFQYTAGGTFKRPKSVVPLLIIEIESTDLFTVGGVDGDFQNADVSRYQLPQIIDAVGGISSGGRSFNGGYIQLTVTDISVQISLLTMSNPPYTGVAGRAIVSVLKNKLRDRTYAQE